MTKLSEQVNAALRSVRDTGDSSADSMLSQTEAVPYVSYRPQCRFSLKFMMQTLNKECRLQFKAQLKCPAPTEAPH